MPDPLFGSDTWRWLAALVMASHLLLVVFVVLGLPAILLGNWRGWRWANAPTWRWLHLATIVVVASEAWLGMVCPLTALERWLVGQARVAAQAEAGAAAGAAAALGAGAGAGAGAGQMSGLGADHPAGFVAHWVSRLLYYDLPPAVFVAAYTLFALGVIAAWWRYPPSRLRTSPSNSKASRASRW